MRPKIFILFFLLSMSLAGLAQHESGTAEKINLPASDRIKSFTLSPVGTKIVFTSLIDNKTKVYGLKEHTLVDLPAGTQPKSVVFSKNEKQAFILSDEKLIVFDLLSAETKTIGKDEFASSKKWLWWYSIWNSQKAELYRLDWNALEVGHRIIPAIDLQNGKLILLKKEGRQELDPLDARYYLSPSLSPDKTKICGVAYGIGTFVCHLNEEIIYGPEKLESPSWVDNEFILATSVDDDGHEVLSSEIILVNIQTGKSESIALNELEAMSPKFNKAENKIYFQTPEGELYSVKIKQIER